MKANTGQLKIGKIGQVTNHDVLFSASYIERLLIAQLTHDPKYMEAFQNLALSGGRIFKIAKTDLSDRLQRSFDGLSGEEQKAVCHNVCMALIMAIAPPDNAHHFLESLIKRVKLIIQ
jgi:hypothetical protein